MEIPQLKIGKLAFKLPIVLGGMGVGLSNGDLLPAVLKEGGMATATSMGLGNLKTGKSNFEHDSREALIAEIRRCYSLTDKHLAANLAVNFMGKVSNTKDLLSLHPMLLSWKVLWPVVTLVLPKRSLIILRNILWKLSYRKC